MNFQTPNYDFIAQAGQQVGQGIQNVKNELDKATLEKAKKVDEQTFDSQIYPAQINIAVEKAKKAGFDDVSAHAMAVRYFPNLKTASPLEKIKMYHENDAGFNQAIQDKQKQNFNQAQAGTPPTPGQPGQDVNLAASRAPSTAQTPANQAPQMSQNATPSQADQSQHPGQVQNAQAQVNAAMSQEQRGNEQAIGNKVMPSIGQAPALAASKAPQMTPTTDVTGMSSGAQLPSEQPPTQTPPTQGQPGKTPTFQELYKMAQDNNLLSDEGVKETLNRMQNGEIVIPQGLDRSQAMQYLMSQGGSLTPERKEQMGALASQNDEMRNKRGQEAIASRDAARKAHDEVERIKVGQSGRKLDVQTKSQVMSKQAEAMAMKGRIAGQIADYQAKITAATKNIEGQMNPQEVESMHTDLQSLYEAQIAYDQVIKGYQDILKGSTSNALPPAKTNTYPAPSNGTPAASKFKVINVQ